MNIIQLTDDRFDEFFDLCVTMVKEAEFSAAEPERHIIWEMCQTPKGIVFLAEKDGKLIGFFAGMIQRYFFSSRERAVDMGFYVLPEHRGSKAAIRLIRTFEYWAKEMGVKEIAVGQTTAVDIEKTLKFYAHLGYKVVGFNTVKHLD